METFSPIVKMTTIRCLISVAAHKDWDLFQLDVNNAFFYGDLFPEVYMQAPLGLYNPENNVCNLVKSLYDQTSRQWFAKLVGALHDISLYQSKNDYSLFIKKLDSHITIVDVYVDNVILTGNDLYEIRIIYMTHST